MTRSLNYLSTALCVAATWSLTATAAPTPNLREAEAAPTTRAPAPRPVAVADLLRSRFQAGFASIDLDRKPVPVVFFAPVSTHAAPNPGTAQDANDFISASWKHADAGVTSLSQPDLVDSMPLGAESISLPSSDVEMLSVPEVPLPLNVIPAFAGIVMVLIAHQRSLKRRNMPK
jgi:hypothetical protein